MNYFTAQMFAIAARINAKMVGLPMPQPLTSTSSFRHCASVEVSGLGPVDHAINRIIDNGCRAAWMEYRSAETDDHMAYGLSGDWVLVLAQRDREQLLAQWASSGHPPGSGWNVRYAPSSERPFWLESVDLAWHETDLRSAIENARGFSDGYMRGTFSAGFAMAIRCLDGEDIAAPLDDLLAGIPGPPRWTHVVRACQHAQVFGGMGSWNDAQPSGAAADAYSEVSQRLFSSLHRTVSAISKDMAAWAISSRLV